MIIITLFFKLSVCKNLGTREELRGVSFQGFYISKFLQLRAEDDEGKRLCLSKCEWGQLRKEVRIVSAIANPPPRSNPPPPPPPPPTS